MRADRGQRGGYFLALKANQPSTLEAVVTSFADRWTPRQRVVEGDWHGDREERRTLEVSSEVGAYLDWPHLAQVCRLHREVEYVSGKRAGQTSEEWAYALTSLPPERADPTRLLALWRGHWQIENGLHYRRDVTCGEEACPVRAGHAPAVCAAVRNTALGLIDPLLRQQRFPNLPAAQRRFAMYPAEALALLGITAPQLE